MQPKTILSLALAAVFAAAAGTAFATEASSTGKPLTAQQQRMKDCNADAGKKSLSGDARKTFMSTCLHEGSKDASGHAKTAQQERMTTCNADAKAKALSGDTRKTFMSTCLKGDGATH